MALLDRMYLQAIEDLDEHILPDDKLPAGWLKFVMPRQAENRAKIFGMPLAKLVASVRQASWPNNDGLVQVRFGGNREAARANVAARYKDLGALAANLTGQEGTALATAVIIHAPNVSPNAPLSHINPTEVIALQTVGVDVSANRDGIAGLAERYMKFRRGRLSADPSLPRESSKVYTTLAGGIEGANLQKDPDLFAALAVEALGAINFDSRRATLYLGTDGTDSLTTRFYTEELGLTVNTQPNQLFNAARSEPITDPTFGYVRRYIL